MPCLDDDSLIRHDESPNVVEFPSAEPMIPGESNGCQPELAMLSIAPNVDVQGLNAVETVEEKPLRPRDAGDPRQ
jgi:hypothetical protein